MSNLLPEKGYYLSSSVVPDFYSWIEVDGEPIKIYGTTESGNKAIGYIEAKEGQEFTIHSADLRRRPPRRAHNVSALVDGIPSARNTSRTVEKFDSALDHESRYKKLVYGLLCDTPQKPWLFGEPPTTDLHESVGSVPRPVKKLGTIKLRYVRIKNLKVPKPKFTDTNSEKVQLSHRTFYGGFRFAAQPYVTYDQIDRQSPFFELEFRYRSRQLLQLEGHIPNSPTPLPLPLPEASTSPVATPPTPVPFTSFAGPPAYASQPSQAAQAKADEERIARRARLAEELEMLRREQRIAVLEREIADLDRQIGSSGGGGSSSSSRKIKAEPSNAQRDAKRVKEETGEAPPAQSSGSGSGKGKEKERKGDMIVLSDSD